MPKLQATNTKVSLTLYLQKKSRLVEILMSLSTIIVTNFNDNDINSFTVIVVVLDEHHELLNVKMNLSSRSIHLFITDSHIFFTDKKIVKNTIAS